jgi:hypothetical protein
VPLPPGGGSGRRSGPPAAGASSPVAGGTTARAPGLRGADHRGGTEAGAQVAMIRPYGPRCGQPRAPSPVTTAGRRPAAGRPGDISPEREKGRKVIFRH